MVFFSSADQVSKLRILFSLGSKIGYHHFLGVDARVIRPRTRLYLFFMPHFRFTENRSP